jgi:hypothetical protein
MKVVSNASALINLARIGKLNLLHELYGELVIPEAVWQEVVIKGAGQPGSGEVKVAAWIKKHATTNSQLVHALQQELDAGEAEAYNGPRNLDRVICYTWERKRGGPSGEFEEAASAVV